MKMQFRLKDIILVLVVLIGMKFLINGIYTDTISIEKLKYLTYTKTIPSLDESNLEQIVLAIESEKEIPDQIIYFGRSSCPYCVESIQKIKNIFDQYELMQIEEGTKIIKKYYFNTDKYDTNKVTKLRNDIGVNYIPSIIIIKKWSSNSFYTRRNCSRQLYG